MIPSIFIDGIVENCANSIWIPHKCQKFEYVGDPSQMLWGPTKTDCQTLSVAAGDYVTGRSAEHENQALPGSNKTVSLSEWKI